MGVVAECLDERRIVIGSIDELLLLDLREEPGEPEEASNLARRVTESGLTRCIRLEVGVSGSGESPDEGSALSRERFCRILMRLSILSSLASSCRERRESL